MHDARDYGRMKAKTLPQWSPNSYPNPEYRGLPINRLIGLSQSFPLINNHFSKKTIFFRHFKRIPIWVAKS